MTCALGLLLVAGWLFSLPRIALAESENGHEATNSTTRSVSDSVAIDMEVAALGNVITNQLKAIGHGNDGESSSGHLHASVFIVSGALLVLLLVAVKFGPTVAQILANRKSTPWIPAPSVRISRADAEADEKVFAEFAAGFRVGPGTATPTHQPALPKTEPAPEKPAPVALPVTTIPITATPEPRPLTRSEFIEAAPKKIKSLRTYLQECSRITGLGRQKILSELLSEVGSIKAGTSDPSLLPLWQLVSAVEGLIRQLQEKPHNLTPSTLRTVAGAVDLFESLLSPIAGPELLSNPPIRFLAVDDDPISRHTISFALKRALTAPDLAENGPAGLALAANTAYDVVFLDVQMPEMDGFEVCSRIHQTEANATTPVVFVTCCNDFNSRATSTLVGGNDLLGKPFITFEITVKALTLALRTRLATARASARLFPAAPGLQPAPLQATAKQLEPLLETA